MAQPTSEADVEIPSDDELSQLADIAARARRDTAMLRRYDEHATARLIAPACLVLGITLPLLAGGWFVIDPTRVARDNALGIALPIGLLVAGFAFLAVLAWLAARAKASR